MRHNSPQFTARPGEKIAPGDALQFNPASGQIEKSARISTYTAAEELTGPDVFINMGNMMAYNTAQGQE